MILGSILRLLMRRSMAIAGGVMLLVVGLLLTARHTALYNQEFVVKIYLRMVCVAFTTFGLLALGGFLAKATEELEGVRLCRVVPGMRRKVNSAILMLVPVVGILSTVFVRAALPDQFGWYDLPPILLTNLFLFCLGLGLGWSWLQFPVLIVFLAKARWLFRQLESSPALFTALMLTGCVALLHLRHRRFMVAGAGTNGIVGWFRSSFSIGARPRRTGQTLRDRPGWDDPVPSVSMGKLIRAGAFERLGQSPYGQLARILFSVLLLYLIFGGLSFWAWAGQKNLSLSEFYAHVFLTSPAHPIANVMRVLFAVITGGLAFISSLMLDTTLKPQLWHPVSRDMKGQAMFFSQLKQNALFAGFHGVVGVAVVILFSTDGGAWPDLRALAAFILPSIYAFVLMPIPQALFPNGVEVFRNKADPKSQLLAGLVGGLMCLLVAYWTSYWPHKSVHESLGMSKRAVLLSGCGLLIYSGYYWLLKSRFATSDLRPRLA